MTRMFRVALAALVVMVVVSGSPEGLHYLSAAPKAAQQTSSFTSTAVALRPTDHPRVPRDLSQFWMAPDKGRVRTAAQANLATAVKFENDGEPRQGACAPGQSGDEAGRPARGVRGLLQGPRAAASRPRRRMRARRSRRCRSRTLVGYLAEMAALREAECDEALGDQAAALAVYERLSATKTLAPDEILMKVGMAAQAVGDADRSAQAAFERVYYDYPLSDLADDAAEQR